MNPGYHIIIFGPPGSGKGTAASWLSKKLEIEHLSTGDILRNHVRNSTPIGKKINKYLEAGGLVPDEFLGRIIQVVMQGRDEKGFILDGYPRNISQVKFLMEVTRIDIVLDMQCPVEIIKNRMLARGRTDDVENVIENRIKVYREQSAPVIDHLRKYCDYIIPIDASGTIEGTQQILSGTMRGHSAFVPF